MKTEHKVVAAAALAGLGFWLVDALLDYCLSHRGSFLDLLITDIPPHELYARTVVFVGVLVFGIALSGVVRAQRRAEAETEAQRQRFVRMVETANALIVGLDPQGRITLFNRKCEEVTGRLAEQVVGREISELAPAQQWASQATGAFAQLRDSGSLDRFEYPWVGADGQECIIAWRPALIAAQNGGLSEVMVIGIDITEQRAAEVALRESETRFRELVDLLPQVICETDEEGHLVFVNRTALEMFGYTAAEAARVTNVLETIAPEDRDRAAENMRRSLRGEELGRTEYMVLRKDGSTFPVAVYASPIVRDGRPVGLRALLIDITEQRRADDRLRAERDRLQVLMDGLAGTGIGLDIVTREYRIGFQNAVLKQAFGDAAGELCYTTYMGREEPCEDCPMVRCLEDGAVHSVELTGADGRDYQLIAAPLPTSRGTADRALEVLVDITARRRAEAELRESEATYRTVFDNTGAATCMLEEDGTIALANEEFARLAGYSSEELQGRMKYTDFIAPYELERMTGYHAERRTSDGEAPDRYEFDFIGREGNTRRILLTIGLIPGTGTSVASLLDVTERKVAEERIVHLNAVLRAIRDVNQLITQEQDPARLLAGACERLIASRGYRSAWIAWLDEDGSLRGAFEAGLGDCFTPVRELLAQGERPQCARAALAEPGVAVFESVEEACGDCPLAAGLEANAAMAAVRLEHAERVQGVVVVSVPGEMAGDDEEQRLLEEIASDIALALHAIEIEEERQEAMEEVARLSDFRESVIDQANVWLDVLDEDGNVLIWNPAAEQISGYPRDEVIGHDRIWEWLYPDPQYREEIIGTAFDAITEGRLVEDLQTTIRTREGDERIISWHSRRLTDRDGQPIGSVAMARDVTEHRELEEQLRRAQTMEVVGQLAGGVAHDFNNVLTAILGHTQLTLREMSDDAPGRRHLEHIPTAVARAADLTHQLLAFGRRQVLRPEVLDLNAVVAELEPMLRRVIEENIELTIRREAETGRVEVDRAQIERVIVNLVVNARDAMPDGGRLTIEIGCVVLDEADVRPHEGLEAGPFVAMTVSDTGIGMDAETLSRIFEPFFTTKQETGTGLGLSTVHGGLTQSGGGIDVDSEPGVGTTFTVYLPRVDSSHEDG